MLDSHVDWLAMIMVINDHDDLLAWLAVGRLIISSGENKRVMQICIISFDFHAKSMYTEINVSQSQVSFISK